MRSCYILNFRSLKWEMFQCLLYNKNILQPFKRPLDKGNTIKIPRTHRFYGLAVRYLYFLTKIDLDWPGLQWPGLIQYSYTWRRHHRQSGRHNFLKSYKTLEIISIQIQKKEDLLKNKIIGIFLNFLVH